MSLYSTITQNQPPKKTLEQAVYLHLQGAVQEKMTEAKQTVLCLINCCCGFFLFIKLNTHLLNLNAVVCIFDL